MLARFRALPHDLRLYVLANLFLGLGMCIDIATFNNYLKDVYALGISERTILEFPRELPGFLAAAFVALLARLGDVRMAAVANLLAGIGMFALGVIPPVYGIMLVAVFVYSTGQHLFMPISGTLAMSFATGGNYGHTVGRINAVNTAALVGGSAVLFIVLTLSHPPYAVTFGVGAACFVAAAVCIFGMNHKRTAVLGKRWMVRKHFSRFYALSIVWGARKQLFLTFGPWILVDLFLQPATVMTMLFFVIAVLGIFLKPWIGKIIDRRGERFVLTLEASVIAITCIVYAFAADVLPRDLALIVVAACYVVDQSSSYAGLARSTYVKKIARDPGEVSPTLSLGVSIDHIASMGIPVLGGLLWAADPSRGYRWVFLSGLGLALINVILARGIPAPQGPAAASHQSAG